MPTYEVTGPDGKTYAVTAPSGATQSQVMAYVRSSLAASESLGESGLGNSTPDSPERIAFNGDVPYMTREPKESVQPRDFSLMDKALGAGEVGLSMLTGGTSGLAGLLGGAVTGLGNQLVSGGFGTQGGADAIQRSALDSAGALTYAPRSEAGHAFMRNLAPTLGVIPPVIGGVGMRPLPRATGMNPNRIRGGFQADVKPEFGQRTAGAAQLQTAQARQAMAESMPIPFKGDSGLTVGQRTGGFQQLQFEKEAAKLAEAGDPLRQRMENQRQTLVSNMDNIFELQRPAAVEPREIGAAVDAAVRARKAQVKQKVTEAYAQARAAGELEEPISLSNLGPVVEGLSDFSGLEGAGVVDAVKRKAVNMGIASIADDGVLTFSDSIPIDRVETLRQFVNDASDVSIPRSAMLRRKLLSAIDDATVDKGGPLYQRARRMAASQFNEFDMSRLAKQVLGTKRGSNERSIALENIAQDVVINAPLDELQKLRGTLLKAGDSGKQAWQDLKAYGISNIIDKAFGVQRGESGAPVSKQASFLRAIEKFDKSGKLEALYGKRQAQVMRDLAELSRIIETAPPGAVNHSNTSSAVMNAVVEMGITASLTGVPAPLLATIKHASKFVKNKALQNRINAALK